METRVDNVLQVAPQDHSEPTYKEWKQNSGIWNNFQYSNSEPTYKEWKLKIKIFE